MDNNENEVQQPTDQTELQADASALISKHCPDETCVMFGLPQPNRKYCIECGTVLVA